MEAINLYCEIIMSDPFNNCLYTETMKDLKTVLIEDHTGPIGSDDTGDHFPLPDEKDHAAYDDYEQEQNRLALEDPFVTKLNQVLTIMDELKTMSIDNSSNWTPKHTEAFQKYLKGFTYYCEQLREDLLTGD